MRWISLFSSKLKIIFYKQCLNKPSKKSKKILVYGVFEDEYNIIYRCRENFSENKLNVFFFYFKFITVK